MEPPEVLAIHAVPHPNRRVQRVGFALDDRYLEQVWAGVIGPSALLGPAAPARAVAQVRTSPG
jgi:hypothetical protein